MSDLLEIQKIIVPRNCIQEAQTHLRRMGESALEGFALWAGDAEGNHFHVQKTIIPDQRAYQTETGICVTVDGEELHRINVWLYDHRMTLIAQIHSHPTDAYHSETDDTYPISTTAGSLSIVVPNFAQADFVLSECAIYRLSPPDEWVSLSVSDAKDLVVFVD